MICFLNWAIIVLILFGAACALWFAFMLGEDLKQVKRINEGFRDYEKKWNEKTKPHQPE